MDPAEELRERLAGYARKVARIDPVRGNALQAATSKLDTFVAAWLRDRFRTVPKPPSASELSTLAEQLGELLVRSETRSTLTSRFLTRDTARLDQPAVRELLTRSRDALENLARSAESEPDEFTDLDRDIVELIVSRDELRPFRAQWAVDQFLHFVIASLPSWTEWRAPLEQCRDGEHPDPGSVFRTILTALTDTTCSSDLLDQALSLLRVWGDALGCRILPESWSFTRPPTMWTLQEGLVAHAVFRSDRPRGEVVRLRSFGLIHNDAMESPAVVSVSAGDAPPGLVDLEALLAGSADPSAEQMRTRLRDWRQAALDDHLESTALALYIDFWDQLRPEMAIGDEVGSRLLTLMTEAFGLQPYYPTTFQSCPAGWVIPAGQQRMVSGRVRMVVRPGLIDAKGDLRVPARAEFD